MSKPKLRVGFKALFTSDYAEMWPCQASTTSIVDVFSSNAILWPCRPFGSLSKGSMNTVSEGAS